jgi:hypothetical protein
MKKLNKLQINPEKVIKIEELISLRGGYDYWQCQLYFNEEFLCIRLHRMACEFRFIWTGPLVRMWLLICDLRNLKMSFFLVIILKNNRTKLLTCL